MATNSYFRTFDAKNEQELLHSLTQESIQIYGHDVSYIPRTLVNTDTVLGEDSISEYKDAYSIEMFIKSVDGFEGCLLYTSPSPRDKRQSRMPSSA